MAKFVQRVGWLFEVLQETCDGHLVFDDAAQVSDVHTLLLHRVTITECHRVVLQRLVVHRHAEWSTDGILTTVTLTDLVFLLVLAVEVELQAVDNLTSLLWQTVLLREWEHCQLDRSQCGDRNMRSTPIEVSMTYGV